MIEGVGGTPSSVIMMWYSFFSCLINKLHIILKLVNEKVTKNHEVEKELGIIRS